MYDTYLPTLRSMPEAGSRFDDLTVRCCLLFVVRVVG